MRFPILTMCTLSFRILPLPVMRASSSKDSTPVSRFACRLNSRFINNLPPPPADHFQRKREKSTLILESTTSQPHNKSMSDI